MKRQTVRVAQFWSPGVIVAEAWSKEVASLDPYAVEWPDSAYAFTLHEREDVVEGETRYTGKGHQVGPIYYHPDSKIESLEEVERNPKASAILVSNMRCNNWSHVVWTRWGNWPQPFDAKLHAVLERHREERQA
jgi:hypothetical protein